MPGKERIIGFEHELVPGVRERSTVYTFRLGHRYDSLKIGDTVKLGDRDTREILGPAEITSITKMKFKDFPIDLPGHKQYSSRGELIQDFQKYSPSMVKDESFGYLIGFKLLDE